VRSRSLLGALIGVLSAAVAIGVGELAAVLVRPAAAPLIAVGNKLILLTPSGVERAATQSVGTNDKPLLITGILVVLALAGALFGMLAVHRLRYGLLGIAALAGFGSWCAVTDNAGRGSDVIPTIIGAAVAAVAMVLLVRTVDNEDADAADDGAPVMPLPRRRAFLLGSAGTAAFAAVAGFGGRAAQHSRFDVTAERNALNLPVPAGDVGITHVPRGADLGRSGVPWATPADKFYRIDTALSLPQISRNHWRLRIHGMVDKEIELSFADLLKRPLVERWVTLCCVSNPVGGPLVGNARWLGVRLADLLRDAGIHDASDQLVMTSDDGMTIGAPTKVVLDGREALLAIGMNGAPLPIEHGYPVRVVVPGLYGYVSACKWVVDIEATTFAAARAYWVQGGWDQQTDIKLESRIDTPRGGSTVPSGRPVPVAGVAWDQHVGVSAVELRAGDGPWQRARLATVPSTDTWRQWVVLWTPPRPGSYRLRVRAVDAGGTPQTEQHANVFPSGATGLHTIFVQAS
jgi:DMSO/TMAO reductase YedYZ molybdopterin-dependent catalytic subunit